MRAAGRVSVQRLQGLRVHPGGAQSRRLGAGGPARSSPFSIRGTRLVRERTWGLGPACWDRGHLWFWGSTAQAQQGWCVSRGLG